MSSLSRTLIVDRSAAFCTLALDEHAAPFVAVSGPAGRRELQALIATGSSYCLLPRRDVEQLGYSTGPYHRRIALLPEVNLGHALSLVTAGILIEAPIVRLERVAVGDVMAEDVDAIVYDLPEATGFDMLLGLTFL